MQRTPTARAPVWVRMKAILRRGGIAALVGALVRRGLRPLVSWDTLWFFEHDLTALTYRPFVATIPLEVRRADREDLGEIKALVGRAGEEAEGLEARLTRGDQCFVGVSKGRLVHASWVATTTAWIPEVRATLRLGPGEAYFYDSLTDPAVRGSGVQPAVVSFAMQEERAQGCRRHLYYLRRNSRSGLKAIIEPRPTRPQTIRCIRITGFPGALVTGLGGAGRPNLELQPGVSRGRLGPWVQWVR